MKIAVFILLAAAVVHAHPQGAADAEQLAKASAARVESAHLVKCQTGRCLAVALVDRTIYTIALLTDVSVSVLDWGLIDNLPIILDRDVIITGPSADRLVVLDISTLGPPVRLAAGVRLTLRALVLLLPQSPPPPPSGLRGSPPSLAPVLPLRAPLPAGQSATVRLQESSLVVGGECSEAPLAGSLPRPAALPGTNQMLRPAHRRPDCRRAASEPTLERCWEQLALYVDFGMYGTDVDQLAAAAGLLGGGLPGYMLHLVQVRQLCGAASGDVAAEGGGGGRQGAPPRLAGGSAPQYQQQHQQQPPQQPQRGAVQLVRRLLHAPAPTPSLEQDDLLPHRASSGPSSSPPARGGAPALGATLAGSSLVVMVGLMAALALCAFLKPRREQGLPLAPPGDPPAPRPPGPAGGAPGAAAASWAAGRSGGSRDLPGAASAPGTPEHQQQQRRDVGAGCPAALVAPSSRSSALKAPRYHSQVLTHSTPPRPGLAMRVGIQLEGEGGTGDPHGRLLAGGAAAAAAAGASPRAHTIGAHSSGGDQQRAGGGAEGGDWYGSGGRAGVRLDMRRIASMGGEAGDMVTLLPTLRGRGAFAKVYEGVFRGAKVAVKMLHEGVFDREEWGEGTERTEGGGGEEPWGGTDEESSTTTTTTTTTTAVAADVAGADCDVVNLGRQRPSGVQRQSSATAAAAAAPPRLLGAAGARPQRLLDSLAREVEVLRRCQHPNIVGLLAACLTPPRVFLVMELMETTLEQLMYGGGGEGGEGGGGKAEPGVGIPAAAAGPAAGGAAGGAEEDEVPGRGRRQALLPLSTVIHIATHICLGLQYLHPTIAHRDLKPANVLIIGADSATPVVKLADFGFSRLRASTMATLNPEAGTPAYMAPECYDTADNVITYHSDMYALGVLLWAMLTARRPWKDHSIAAVAYKVAMLNERPPLDHISDQRCPPKLRRLITECWDRDPRRRPAAAMAAKELVLVQQQLERQRQQRVVNMYGKESCRAASGTTIVSEVWESTGPMAAAAVGGAGGGRGRLSAAFFGADELRYEGDSLNADMLGKELEGLEGLELEINM